MNKPLALWARGKHLNSNVWRCSICNSTDCVWIVTLQIKINCWLSEKIYDIEFVSGIQHARQWRGIPGIEPGTSRTLSENHAARPNPQHVSCPQTKFVASCLLCVTTQFPKYVLFRLLLNHHFHSICIVDNPREQHSPAFPPISFSHY
jgi:hypothetical protein